VSDLNDIADGLLALVEGDGQPPAPEPTLTEEVADEAATAALDYVLSEMRSGDSAELLGEAVVMGAYGAAVDMRLDGDVIAEAAVARLEGIASCARALLEGDTCAGQATSLAEAAPAAQQKVLAALKDGKRKLTDIAAALGGDVKAASSVLRALQKQGRIDYNLKTGYSII
jgi:hypothetical protein